MTMLRAFAVAAILGGLAAAACGSAGSGGSGGGITTAAPSTPPALGTDKPPASPKMSGDPYSDYGY